MDDVLKNVREDFLNEGVDTQVLEDLKQVYEEHKIILLCQYILLHIMKAVIL